MIVSSNSCHHFTTLSRPIIEFELRILQTLEANYRVDTTCTGYSTERVREGGSLSVAKLTAKL